MKKLISLLCCLIIATSLTCVTSLASEQSGSVNDILPSETSNILEQSGFDSFDVDTLKELDVSDILSYVKNILSSEIKTPFMLIYAIFVIILIITIARGISGKALGHELDKSLDTVGVLSLCTTVLTPIISCLTETEKFIVNMSNFTKSFAPVLAGVMVASGQSTTGLGYQAVMLCAVELLSSFLSGIIMPLLFIFLAISIVSKTTSFINLNSLTSSVKSGIIWTLSLSTGLFVALITIKGLIGSGADSLTLRTGKFFVGSFVPAVGSALSEAASTAIKGAGIIRDATGIYGIIAAALYVLPPLIKVLLYKFTCDVSAVLAEALGTSKVSAVIKDISVVLGLLSSVILTYGLVMILSTALTLLIGGGI